MTPRRSLPATQCCPTCGIERVICYRRPTCPPVTPRRAA